MFCPLDANENKKDIEIRRTIMMSLYPKIKIFEKIFLHRGIHDIVDSHDTNIKSYLKKLRKLEN